MKRTCDKCEILKEEVAFLRTIILKREVSEATKVEADAAYLRDVALPRTLNLSRPDTDFADAVEPDRFIFSGLEKQYEAKR